jgi:hypothetical protein
VLPLAWAHALAVAAVKEDGRGSGEDVVCAAIGLGTCTRGHGWSCGSMLVVIGSIYFEAFWNQSNSFVRGQSATLFLYYACDR